jgi:hypothetical protein
MPKQEAKGKDKDFDFLLGEAKSLRHWKQKLSG